MPHLFANSKQESAHAHAASKANCDDVRLDMAHSIMKCQAWYHLHALHLGLLKWEDHKHTLIHAVVLRLSQGGLRL